jgi:hypothetical protein
MGRIEWAEGQVSTRRFRGNDVSRTASWLGIMGSEGVRTRLLRLRMGQNKLLASSVDRERAPC